MKRNFVKIDLVTGKAELYENYKKVCEADIETILQKIGIDVRR